MFSRFIAAVALTVVFVFAAHPCSFEIVIGERSPAFASGLKEDVPKSLRERYARWKDELFTTEYGRDLWSDLTTRRDFKLTIIVTNDRKRGAGTDKLEFDRDGQLIGVTITLGADLDRGYPSSFYYPVIESLSAVETNSAQHGRLLAGTKLAHELGHVEQILNESPSMLLLQDRLTPKYRNIFLENGWNSRDERLVAIADQMGGTPTSIWETREYTSETIALRFLVERTKDAAFQCDLMKRIRRNVDSNAGVYRPIFDDIDEFSSSSCK